MMNKVAVKASGFYSLSLKAAGFEHLPHRPRRSDEEETLVVHFDRAHDGLGTIPIC